MNKHAKIEAQNDLIKTDPGSPVLRLVDGKSVALKACSVSGHSFADGAPVALPDKLEPGTDYAVVVIDGHPTAIKSVGGAVMPEAFAGFHQAPGGNASARTGGDDVPAINPCSFWDLNFRAACTDPRGMVLVEDGHKRFWCDIYLTGADCHLNGTSRFGIVIADGNDRPVDPVTGRRLKCFDHASALAVLRHHGKGLLSFEEFAMAAFGVTERAAAGDDPHRTGLDDARTSKFGLMQATGNLWVWGHDGDPDAPRASILGGSWWSGGVAGSRCASLDYWAGFSDGYIGARGRSDHLQLD